MRSKLAQSLTCFNTCVCLRIKHRQCVAQVEELQELPDQARHQSAIGCGEIVRETLVDKLGLILDVVTCKIVNQYLVSGGQLQRLLFSSLDLFLTVSTAL